ncbi:hypothetical protein [Sinorhizobium meliloti]|uniref:hypothetical protein n=1 Tax=Rhizobium meliloti TaxID=382 RepID=UPI0034E57162
MAALWKLPVVTRTTVTPVTEISRGLGADRFLETRRVLRIPGEPVDGMDVRSVHAARQARSSMPAPARARTSSRCTPIATARPFNEAQARPIHGHQSGQVLSQSG